MKRSLVLLFLGAAAALGIWYGMRAAGPLKTSNAAVTALLPKETLALFHLPDFNRTRKHWREPAVQEFLQKPLSRVPNTAGVRERIQQLASLEVKDAFLALTGWAEERPILLAGFHFKGSNEDAEKVIGHWRVRAQQHLPAAKRETVEYEKHRIEAVTHNAKTIATVYDGNWFFAANDVAALKSLLDRADGRLKDPASTLAADENFTASLKHLPASYAAFGYGRLDQYFQKLAVRLPQDGSASGQAALVSQVRSISAATSFDNGRIRDVLYVAMPRLSEAEELNRNSLSLTTKDSFLYMASVLAWPREMALPGPQAIAAGGIPPALQQLVAAFGANGITLEEWNSAFGQEVGLVGDWPENARWPALFATLPVKDVAKAKRIAAIITSGTSAGEGWSTSDKEGVQYYARAPANPMIPVAPAAGISDRWVVLGLDLGFVEAAIKRGAATNSGLAGAQTFKDAERLVPAAKQSFTYLDSALLYQRLDAALRPMLVMAAAFVPRLAEQVDLTKLPAAEVITKHLSPVAISQGYRTDGYVTESVGPVSIYQGLLAAVAVSGAGAAFYQHQTQPGGSGIGNLGTATPMVTPGGASPSPAGTP
ncbi:MAG: hypothetical protein ABR589_05110 [Chthoniobacterales bacterium]